MNATRWHTLSGFVQWLGKTGYAKIDFVEEKNQWYVEYIDNSPETLQRNAEKTPFFWKAPNLCTKFDPLNNFFKRRALYYFKAWEFRNMQAFEYF